MLEGQVRGISLVVSSNGFNDAPIQVLVTLTPGTAQREWYSRSTSCFMCTVVYHHVWNRVRKGVARICI